MFKIKLLLYFLIFNLKTVLANNLLTDTLNENILNENYSFNFDNINIENEGLALNTYDFLNLEKYKTNPLQLNKITKNDLDKFEFLSAVQKENFFLYKKSNGIFIDINEIQNIPYWSNKTTKIFQQYITLNFLNNNFKKSKNTFIFQNTYNFNKLIAYNLSDTNNNKFLGIPNSFFLKYNLSYNNIDIGFKIKQNAGEKINNNFIFNYYSFFVKLEIKNRFLTSIYIGDYTVQLSQGLIEWQKFSFNKSQEVLNIKKEFPVFQVHNSMSSTNFKRGLAFNFKFKNLSINPFISYRILDSKIDSFNNVNSIIKTGYYRSYNEMIIKNNLSELSYGFSTKYDLKNLFLGFNFVAYNFNHTLYSNTTTNPNNHYPFKDFYNLSFNYEYNYNSISLFGEIALDKYKNVAILNGLQVAINKYFDVSILHRYYDVFYQAIYANAFRENSTLNNENGLYLGLNYNLTSTFQIQYYIDLVYQPWLKYNQFSGSRINDNFIKLNYILNKFFNVSFLASFKLNKFTDYVLENNVLNTLTEEVKNKYRIKLNYLLNNDFEINTQYDVSMYKNNFTNQSSGFSISNDLIIKKVFNPNIKLNIRLQYFEIPNGNNLIYVFEKDVFRDFTLNAYSGKGIRYFINVHYNLLKNILFSLKWSQSFYSDKESVSYYSLEGNLKSDLKAQFYVSF